MKNSAKILLVLTSLALGSLLFLLLSLFVLRSFLKNPENMESLISRLNQTLLKNQNMELKVGGGTFDLFNHLDLKDLQLILSQKNQNLTLKAKEIKISWDFDLSDRKIILPIFRVAEVSINGNLKLEEPQAELEEKSNGSWDLESFEKISKELSSTLEDSLPIYLKIDRYEVTFAKSDLSLEDTKTRRQFTFDEMELTGSIEISNSRITKIHSSKIKAMVLNIAKLNSEGATDKNLASQTQQTVIKIDHFLDFNIEIPTTPKLSLKTHQWKSLTEVRLNENASGFKDIKLETQLNENNFLEFKILVQGNLPGFTYAKITGSGTLEGTFIAPSGDLNFKLETPAGPKSKLESSLSLESNWKLLPENLTLIHNGTIQSSPSFVKRITDQELKFQNLEFKNIFSVASKKIESLKAKLVLSINRWMVKEQPVNLHQKLDLEFSMNEKTVNLNSVSSWNESPVAKIQSTIEIEPKAKEIQAHFDLKLMEAPQDLTQLLNPLVYPKDTSIVFKFKKDPKNINIEGKGSIPNFLIKDLLDIENTNFNLSFEQDGTDAPFVLKLNTTLQTLNANIQNKRVEINDFLKLNAEVSVQPDSSFTFEDFTFENPIIDLDLKGRGQLKNQNIKLYGDLKIKSTQELQKIARSQGEIKVPWELSITEGKQLALSSSLAFKEFGIQMPLVSFSGLSGTFPVKMNWVQKGPNWTFSNLIQRSGFERVAFDKIQPFLTTKEPIKIESIQIENKKLGPFRGYASLEQNLLSLHKFDLIISKSHISGEGFLDLHPSQLGLGILARFSKIDLSKILPDRYLNKIKIDKALSGRQNLVFNLVKGNLNGRMDVTDMSSGQLLALMNVLDPELKDTKLNHLRNLLLYAYPTYVGMDFQNSFVDFKVHTNVMNFPIIKAIPIGSQINEITNLIRSILKEVPIK